MTLIQWITIDYVPLTHYLTAQQHIYVCPVHTIISDMIFPSA